MSAPPLFDDAMKIEGRIYLRVSQDAWDQCKRIGQRWDMRPGTAARELIMAGHVDGRVPALRKEPKLVPMNISFTDEMKEELVVAAKRISEEYGISMDVAQYARRCLHRGIELATEDRRALVSWNGKKQRMYFEADARR